jgi:hypothetical protein
VLLRDAEIHTLLFGFGVAIAQYIIFGMLYLLFFYVASGDFLMFLQ